MILWKPKLVALINYVHWHWRYPCFFTRQQGYSVVSVNSVFVTIWYSCLWSDRCSQQFITGSPSFANGQPDWPWLTRDVTAFVIIVDGCWFDVHHNVHNVIGSQSISPLSHLKITRACRLGFPRKRPFLTENDPITITIFNPQNYIAYFFKKLQHNLPKWCIITNNGGCGGFGEDTAHNNKRKRFSVNTSRWWKIAIFFL